MGIERSRPRSPEVGNGRRRHGPKGIGMRFQAPTIEGARIHLEFDLVFFMAPNRSNSEPASGGMVPHNTGEGNTYLRERLRTTTIDRPRGPTNSRCRFLVYD